MRDTITNRAWRARLILAAMLLPATAAAQRPVSAADSVRLSPSYWPKLVGGAAVSILAHEAAHVATSYAVGGHPTFGFEDLRPTVYSGIDSHVEPRRQFYFSISGLVIQSLLDEAILDVPHRRGGAFERGLVAGGLGTTLFYLTVGRWGSVSDIDFIARTHAMNKTQLTLLFGSIVGMHAWRIARDAGYDHFFLRPGANGRLDVGLSVGR